MIDVIVKLAISHKPVIAQRLDNKRFIVINWNPTNWTNGDFAEVDPSDITSEHDTYCGAIDKIGVEAV